MALPTLQRLRRRAAGGPRPAAREYGLLFAAVLGALLLQPLTAWGVDAATEWLPRVLDPQLVGGVVYAALGTALLAGGYAVARSLGRAPRLAADERVSLGGVAALILFVAAYRLHEDPTVPTVPEGVTTALLGGGAFALVAVGYARLLGTDLRLGPPGRERLGLAAGVALVAGLAGVGWVFAAATWTRTPLVVTLGGGGAPAFPVEALHRVVASGVLVGGGMALLYNGAIQERLRGRLGPAGAAAAATTLAGASFVELLPSRGTDPVSVVAGTVATLLLALLVAAVAAWTVGALRRVDGSEPTPLVGAAVGVAAVVLPLVVLVPLQAAAWRTFLYPAPPVVAAAAAVGYERSRSAWVPVLAFVVYLVVADWAVVTYVSRLVG
jgi:hypothetical protein